MAPKLSSVASIPKTSCIHP